MTSLKSKSESLPPNPPSTGKRRLGRLALMVLVPAALLILIEVLLRVAGIEEAAPGIEVTHFTDGRMQVHVPAPSSTVPGHALFSLEKKAGTLRIAFVGASTTRGVPHEEESSFPAMVVARLQELFPNQPIEGINLGVPTEPVRVSLGLCQLALEADCDLLVVEAGHNESLNNNVPAVDHPLAGLRRYLENLRLGRLLIRAERAFNEISVEESIRLGLGDIKDEHFIEPATARKRREKIEAYFRDDLNAIAELAAAVDVPLVLVIPPSSWRNYWPEKAFPPKEKVDVPYPRELEAMLEALILHSQAPGQGDPSGLATKALQEVDRKIEAYGELALLLHWRGQILEFLDRYEEAAQMYAQAFSNDPLPICATPRTNAIMHEVGASHSLPVADVQKVFEEHSPHGIVGLPLVVDHCHPGLRGQYLMATAVLKAIRASGVMGADWDWHEELDPSLARTLQLLRVNPALDRQADSLAGFAALRSIIVSASPRLYAARALLAFDRALKTWPQDATLLVASGLCQLILGRDDQGEQAIRQGLALNRPLAEGLLEMLLDSSSRVASVLDEAGLNWNGQDLIRKDS